MFQMQAFYDSSDQAQPYSPACMIPVPDLTNFALQPGMVYCSNWPYSSVNYFAPHHWTDPDVNMMASNPVVQYSQAAPSQSYWQPRRYGQHRQQQAGKSSDMKKRARNASINTEPLLALAPVRSNACPRKALGNPKQNGYAIWIGNLPCTTQFLELVDHVCLQTVGVVSIFFIAKSRCAFVNFKEQQESVDAQQKLHATSFQKTQLICRMQRTHDSGNDTASPTKFDQSSLYGPPLQKSTSTPQSKSRFFILKSHTRQDLEHSVATGIWSTQTQNEKMLEEAYEGTENVYLIFSANKSGEYFGYARMASQINHDPGAAIDFAPRHTILARRPQPKPVLLEAAGNRPMGHIVHNSDKDTMLWEVVRDNDDDDDDDDSDSHDSVSNHVVGSELGVADDEIQTHGKPFNLTWLSSSPLPFWQTRGLNNPWNSNRAVKVARDGTELEPSVGKALIRLFNRSQSP